MVVQLMMMMMMSPSFSHSLCLICFFPQAVRWHTPFSHAGVRLILIKLSAGL